MEEASKELDFQCAVVVGIIGDVSVDSFRKLSSLKLNIETQLNYQNVLTEILTFSTLQLGSNEFVDSVSAEVTYTRARVKNMVNNYMHNECVLFTEVCPDGREDQA